MVSRVEVLMALLILLIASSSLAFAPRHVGAHPQSIQCMAGRMQHSAFPSCRYHTILYSTPSEDEDSASNDSTTTTTTTDAKATESVAEPDEGTQYPINVPSPLLLAAGMILAIVSTGTFVCVL